MNKKSLYILNLFLTFDKYNVQDLEKILKIRKRSVIENIKTINNFLKTFDIDGIIEKNNLFCINKKEKGKVKALLRFYSPLGLRERMDYILLKLFFYESLKVSTDFLEIDVTRRTINNDLQKIKEHLQEYNLSFLSFPSKGIFLKGEEKDIRVLFSKYLAKCLIQKNNCHDLFNKLLNNTFGKSNLKEAEEMILNLSEKLKISLPIEYFYYLVAVILVNFYRKDKELQFFQEYNTPKYLLNDKKYELLTIFFKNSGLKKLKLYELDIVIDTFLCFDKEFYLEKFDDEVENFLNKLENILNIDIPNDDEFLMKVTNVIKIGKFKAEVNLSKNNENYKLENEYEQYYEKINFVIKEIIPKFCNDDILYLTILIKDTIDKLKLHNKKYKKVIVVDNSFNQILGTLLSKYLKNNYLLNILKIIPSYELNKNLNIEFNYLISLNNLDIENI
ncbi:MAG: helix-turn-helix domain-containing protein, partial [Cetobacterium sp.]